MNLKQNVLLFIKKKSLIKPGSRVLIGISGGLDSVVLTHLLYQLQHELSISLVLAHFNHRLRPNASRDERFVKALAKELNLKLISQARKGVLKHKASEDEARQWRYDFFYKTAKHVKADAIILAHHENDMAETVLMRLLRGTGLNGLKAIQPKRMLQGIALIRPLINISKVELEAYAKGYKLSFCEDETNKDTVFLRNKVRRELLPLLAKSYNPQIISVLSDLAQTASEDYEFINEIVFNQVKENLVKFAQTVKIKQSFFDNAHPALRRLALRQAYQMLQGDLNNLTYAHIQEAEDLLQTRPFGSVVHWPKGILLNKKKGFIELRA